MKKTRVIALLLVVAMVCALAAACANNALANYAEAQNKAFEATNSDTMSVLCEARGKKLAYTYKYETMTADIAEASLDTQDSTFGTLLTLAKVASPSCEAVIVEIADKDGKVLASKEYK